MNPIFNSESLLKIDQYDGEVSDIWHMYIGDHKTRTDSYRDWLCNLLRSYNCERVLDAATGTGIDSLMLVEQGFQVTSIDNSERMLEKARELKSQRKHLPRFDSWVIHQANWITLEEDLKKEGELEKGLFDAVILLGNSFSHLPSLDLQQQAIRSFYKVLKPGGILVIDHRNYDAAMSGERVSQKSSYYNGDNIDKVDTYMISKNGKYTLVVLDYFIKNENSQSKKKSVINFKLYFYPVALEQMKKILTDNFNPAKIETYGDFELIKDENSNPSYFCHVVQK